MSRIRKIILTTLFAIVIFLSYMSIDIATSEPGLHYMFAAYGAGLTFIIGGLFFFLTRKTTRLKYLTFLFLTIGFFTLIPTVDPGLIGRIFMGVLNGLGILGYVYSIK